MKSQQTVICLTTADVVKLRAVAGFVIIRLDGIRVKPSYNVFNIALGSSVQMLLIPHTHTSLPRWKSWETSEWRVLTQSKTTGRAYIFTFFGVQRHLVSSHYVQVRPLVNQRLISPISVLSSENKSHKNLAKLHSLYFNYCNLQIIPGDECNV